MTMWGRTPHKIQVNIDPDTKTKSFLSPRHKTNQFRSLNWNQVNIYFDAHTKPWDLPPASKKRVSFDHHSRKHQVNWSSNPKKVNFGPHTFNFDPPHKKQVTFGTNTKTKSNSIPRTKIKLISTPLLKSCQFGPHSKIKSISMPLHKNQVNFDLHINTTSFLTLTQNTGQFRSQHCSQVNFDPHYKWS